MLWASAAQAYTAARESPAILAAELGGLGAVSAAAAADGGGADFSVKGSLGAREAVAVLAVEEGATLEMAVRLPPAWPLRPPTAECRRRVRGAPARAACKHLLMSEAESAGDGFGATLDADVRLPLAHSV